MSFKDNVNAIKEELSTEEQFLESVIKAEGFWKKYKKIILFVAGAILLAIVAKLVMDYMHQSSLLKSNQAYAKLLSNRSDTGALSDLESSNPRLYEMFIFKKGVKSNNIEELKSLKGRLSDPILIDLLSYQIDSLTSKDLSSYSTSNGAILKDLAIYENAYLMMKDGKVDEARKRLDEIDSSSPLYGLSQNLKHYQGK